MIELPPTFDISSLVIGIIIGIVVGVAGFILLTTDGIHAWHSAHQLGKRNNAAFAVLLACVFFVYAFLIRPMQANWHRLEPFLISTRDYTPYGVAALLIGIVAIVFIGRKFGWWGN